VVINTGQDSREDVWLKTGCVEQIILKQLTWLVGFVEHLQWQICMRPVGQLGQPILQLSWQISNIPATANRNFIGCGVRVRVARRRRLLCPSSVDA
jgi:hypothetical protein